jgi:hypothetical protein
VCVGPTTCTFALHFNPYFSHPTRCRQVQICACAYPPMHTHTCPGRVHMRHISDSSSTPTTISIMHNIRTRHLHRTHTTTQRPSTMTTVWSP